MPIISQVEARSTKGRLVYAAIFVVLGAAGITMIYPFAIMVSGSLRTPMDQPDLDLIPKFLVDDETLYRKFLETKYNHDLGDLNAGHVATYTRFATVPPPPQVDQRQVEDLQRFARETDLPKHWQVLGGIAGGKIAPERLREIMDRVRQRYDGDLAAFSRDAGTPISGWTRLFITVPKWVSQQYDYPRGPIYETYFEVLDEAPLAERQLVSVTGYFLDQMVYPIYGRGGVEAFNKAHPDGPQISAYSDVVLPPAAPSQEKFRAEWIEFVQKDLHPSFVVLDNVSHDSYRKFLAEKYSTIERLNTEWSTRHDSFDALALPDGRQWLSGVQSQDYHEFVLDQPVENWRLVGPEYAWRDWLGQQNAGENFDRARLPVEQLEYQHAMRNKSSLRWDYALRNYAVVFRELISQGRPFWNTLIICGATVLLTLLVNPMAAYAMSRFQLPGTYKIILLLMVTTAFPPMVVMVPKFLILRESGLLNTYFALVIPFVANGYLIFLLKGFFDSLPTNLYEAAMIEGASELRMFFTITMALSKPILAVVALQAFNAAYTMFLYALIVCPQPQMWTLNVWIYQWQAQATTAGVFASLLIAAIPTLLLFLFAQNVIMKGIVVPVEK